MSVHLSDDQLIDRLYGIGRDHEHLESCPACQSRWIGIQERREEAAGGQLVPAEFLQQQRRQIQDRLAKPRPALGTMWVPATLAIALMAGIFITRPASKSPAPAPRIEAEVIEGGWFEEAYSATRELEPRAASPLRQLFQEGPVPE